MTSQKKAIGILILVLSVLPFFQNCSGCSDRVQFTNSTGQISLQSGDSSSGNGQPYEGKPEPGKYYRLIPEFQCNGQGVVYAQLDVSEDQIKLATTDPTTCTQVEQILAADQVQSLVFNPSYLGHLSGIYERADTAPNPNASEIQVNESWCRLEQPSTFSFDIIVQETLPSERMTATIRGAHLSQSGQVVMDPQQSIEVMRRFQGAALTYQADGFDLRLNLNAEVPGFPGQFSGNLSRLAQGQTQTSALVCRTGAKFDAKSDVRPSLVLDLSIGPLPTPFVFTRTSEGSYFDQQGLLRFAAIGQPRFEFDPSTLKPAGLLIEGAAANQISQSNEMSDGWAIEASTNTKATTAPDGSNSAIRLTESLSASSVVHQIGYNVALDADTLYTLSYFAKANSRPATELGVTNKAGVKDTINFNLQTGALIEGPTGGIVKSAGIQALPNGWYRVWATFNAGTGSVAQPVVSVRPHKGTTPFGGMYPGDGTSGIYVWGLQLEQGSVATSYIATQAGAASRAEESVTLNQLDWLNAAEGSILVRANRFFYEPNSSLETPHLFDLWGLGSDSYKLFVGSSPTFSIGATLSSASASPVTLQTSGSAPIGTNLLTAAFAYKAGDSALIAFDSVKTAPANTAVGFTLQALDLGGQAGQSRLNGHVRSFEYWPARLSNETLLKFAR